MFIFPFKSKESIFNVDSLFKSNEMNGNLDKMKFVSLKVNDFDDILNQTT